MCGEKILQMTFLLEKKKRKERIGNMVVLYLDSSSSKATTKLTSPETKLRV